ncbi:unnamed protein product [Acanthoscelides obtectus]|uniref:Uncharacterized protein n=1 Tax=Acanthoscelides obtectus TaxID=200917 RepID=A0A9P0P1W6_ACAOB|nr:unnamed protein product [Acanthoscelides obtectus]CAK1657108.1 hypothetical protein AOBTE_LOCUS20125 [Acanthoscelides obtectus]
MESTNESSSSESEHISKKQLFKMIKKLKKKVHKHRHHSPAPGERKTSRSRSLSRRRSRSRHRPARSRDRSPARDYHHRDVRSRSGSRQGSVDRHPRGPTFSDFDDRSLRETESIIIDAAAEPDGDGMAGTSVELGRELTASKNASPVLEIDMQEDEFSMFLGEDPNIKNKNIFELHKALCTRWGHILSHGLDKDQKQKILERYPLPSNCPEINAPLVNPEVVGVLSNPHIKRDEAHLGIQKQLNVGISALGKSMNIILEDKENIPKEIKEQLLISLGDSGRIFSDLSFNISTMRKNLIMPNLNKTVKDLVSNTTPVQFLFGSDIGERIKEAKSIERAKKDLKPEPMTTQPSTSTNSSYRRPHTEANVRPNFKVNPIPLNRKRPVRRGEVKPQRGHHPKKEQYQRRRHYW